MSTAYCENYYDSKTKQWEYAPRYVTVERGRLISQDCAKCGQSIDIGRHGAKCTNCQIDAANTRRSPE